MDGNSKNKIRQTQKEGKKREKKSIKMKYIWFYNVYILIVKSFIPTIIQVAHHFEKVHASMFTRQISHTRSPHTRIYGDEEHDNL